VHFFIQAHCLTRALSVASSHPNTTGHAPESVQSHLSQIQGNVVKKSLFVKTAVALALAAPLLASAESQLVVGGNNSAAARLDFRVVVPRVLLLQVGTVGSVDLVEFDLGTNEPGTGTPVGRTGGAAVPVRVLGNNGPITLAVTNSGDLTTGTAGETIPWTQIAVTSTSTSGSPIPHPSAAFNGNTVLTTTAGKVTNSQANWTFNYLNNLTVPAGTYGGVNTNNGRVTYTASML